MWAPSQFGAVLVRLSKRHTAPQHLEGINPPDTCSRYQRMAIQVALFGGQGAKRWHFKDMEAPLVPLSILQHVALNCFCAQCGASH